MTKLHVQSDCRCNIINTYITWLNLQSEATMYAIHNGYYTGVL